MHRPGYFICALVFGGGFAAPVSAAVLAPSVDPVATFITVADSVARTEGDAGLSAFVADNAILVGASVAKLLDVAFQVAQGGDNAAASENVAFAKNGRKLIGPEHHEAKHDVSRGELHVERYRRSKQLLAAESANPVRSPILEVLRFR